MSTDLPNCCNCNQGMLLPLSDFGPGGATVPYKAWVCTNPECGFNIRIDNGNVSIGLHYRAPFKRQ